MVGDRTHPDVAVFLQVLGGDHWGRAPEGEVGCHWCPIEMQLRAEHFQRLVNSQHFPHHLQSVQLVSPLAPPTICSVQTQL